MQVALVLLAIVGSTAWLAMDAAKRDWSENSFSKNVPTWVAGSLLLWPVVFPMYVFAHRKQAPLKNPPVPKRKPEPEPQAAAEPAPAVALDMEPPAEQYGPSLEEAAPPAPVERVVERDPVVELEPEPEREPVIELRFHEGEEPVFDISRPAAEAAEEPVALSDEAPPSFSVDAFKDVKPVSFGGFAGSEDEEPSPDLAPQPEPNADVAPEPVADVAPEPVVDVAPDLSLDVSPAPLLDVQPAPMVEIEPQPAASIEPEPIGDLDISYPSVDAEPVIHVEPEPIEPAAYDSAPYEPYEPSFEPQPYDPVAAAAGPEPETPAEDQKPTKARSKFNPEIKLPSFGRKKAKVAAATADAPKEKGGFKLPNPQLKLPKLSLSRGAKDRDSGSKKSFLNLPPNLQGPLSDVERKIALGSVVAVVAAAAFGYMSAPSEDSTSATSAPPPTATSR